MRASKFCKHLAPRTLPCIKHWQNLFIYLLIIIIVPWYPPSITEHKMKEETRQKQKKYPHHSLWRSDRFKSLRFWQLAQEPYERFVRSCDRQHGVECATYKTCKLLLLLKQVYYFMYRRRIWVQALSWFEICVLQASRPREQVENHPKGMYLGLFPK
jgi:hypothetical protein